MKYYEIMINYEIDLSDNSTSYINRVKAKDMSEAFNGCVEQIKEIESRDITLNEVNVIEISKEKYDYYEKLNSN